VKFYRPIQKTTGLRPPDYTNFNPWGHETLYCSSPGEIVRDSYCVELRVLYLTCNCFQVQSICGHERFISSPGEVVKDMLFCEAESLLSFHFFTGI
jgi:hypothetical protein